MFLQTFTFLMACQLSILPIMSKFLVGSSASYKNFWVAHKCTSVTLHFPKPATLLLLRVLKERIKPLYIQSNEIHNVVALIKFLLILRCQLYVFQTVTFHPQELLLDTVCADYGTW